MDAVIKLVDSLKEEVERLKAQLAAEANIRRYLAFVLAGDEAADVQVAADGLRTEYDRLRAAIVEWLAASDALRLDWVDHDVSEDELEAMYQREEAADADLRVIAAGKPGKNWKAEANSRGERLIDREAWRLLFDRCFVCGREGTDVHEIARGPHRAEAMKEPAAWIKCCRRCHDRRLATMPIVQQLAIKLIHDPQHYDRVTVNLLRHRQPDAVSEREVAIEVAALVSEVFR